MKIEVFVKLCRFDEIESSIYTNIFEYYSTPVRVSMNLICGNIIELINENLDLLDMRGSRPCVKCSLIESLSLSIYLHNAQVCMWDSAHVT